MRNVFRSVAVIVAVALCVYPLSMATGADSARRETGQNLQMSISGG